jgi:hypothetical protein
MSKKSTSQPTPEELKKQVKGMFSGVKDLKDAQKVLENLTDTIKGFESGLLKNDNVQAAKTRHLANLASVLMEVLRDNDSCDLNDEDDIIKLAKIFTERYDKEVLSNIGM